MTRRAEVSIVMTCDPSRPTCGSRSPQIRWTQPGFSECMPLGGLQPYLATCTGLRGKWIDLKPDGVIGGHRLLGNAAFSGAVPRRSSAVVMVLIATVIVHCKNILGECDRGPIGDLGWCYEHIGNGTTALRVADYSGSAEPSTH